MQPRLRHFHVPEIKVHLVEMRGAAYEVVSYYSPSTKVKIIISFACRECLRSVGNDLTEKRHVYRKNK